MWCILRLLSEPKAKRLIAALQLAAILGSCLQPNTRLIPQPEQALRRPIWACRAISAMPSVAMAIAKATPTDLATAIGIGVFILRSTILPPTSALRHLGQGKRRQLLPVTMFIN